MAINTTLSYIVSKDWYFNPLDFPRKIRLENLEGVFLVRLPNIHAVCAEASGFFFPLTGGCSEGLGAL